MKLRGIKRVVVAAAVAVATATAGMAGQAQAFSFADGDLVLAIYGNSTEALYNLGAASTRLANGASFSQDVSPGLQAAALGTNPVKYTLFGHDFLNGGNVFAGTSVNPSSINLNQLGLVNQFNASANAQAFSIFAGDTIPKADDLRSFTGNFNQSGAGNLASAWPVAMQGGLGDLLTILKGNVETNNAFTQVGRILLTADGQLTIGNPGPALVPLPAGFVLFASGLIGLIGIARRAFNQKAT